MILLNYYYSQPANAMRNVRMGDGGFRGGPGGPGPRNNMRPPPPGGNRDRRQRSPSGRGRKREREPARPSASRERSAKSGTCVFFFFMTQYD